MINLFAHKRLKKFKSISYEKISKQKLHSEEISNHVAIIARNKEIRKIVNQFQKLSECEWHVFQILKKQLASLNKVRYVDFQKEKRKN